MTVEQFWASLKPTENGCLEFTRTRRKTGYGQVMLKGDRVRLAHRVAMELHLGHPIPEGMLVCHRCDNPPCCNPEHLFLGTVQDNMRDMMEKRQAGRPGGAHRGSRGLTDAQVQEAYAMKESGIGSFRIAKTFGVAHHTIKLMFQGKTYKEFYRPTPHSARALKRIQTLEAKKT